jgi:hypothetical protein
MRQADPARQAAPSPPSRRKIPPSPTTAATRRHLQPPRRPRPVRRREAAHKARVAAVTAGLPPLPELSAPVLAARPRAASAWDELAAAYAATPATSKPERAAVAVTLARLWQEGAGQQDPRSPTSRRPSPSPPRTPASATCSRAWPSPAASRSA